MLKVEIFCGSASDVKKECNAFLSGIKSEDVVDFKIAENGIFITIVVMHEL
jgi:hypothetical protein